NEIYLDQKLFGRVDALWKSRASLGLNPEQAQLLKLTHERFVRAGAALKPEARARVAAINEEMANLGVQFGQMLLAE
ncbi:M3 family metallopeptidase, partial [Acinetobacter baumannii]|nr:M3 family metallopeptidase [Acinetobacter baumannii]